MKHQRIYTAPISRITRPTSSRDGIPARWDDSTVPLPALPPGQAWVPIVERPAVDEATQYLTRNLTLTEDGWTVNDFTPEEIAAMQAEEAERVEEKNERDTLKAAYDLFKSGNANAAQVQRAIAYLIKKTA